MTDLCICDAGRIETGLDPESGLYEQFAGFHALEPLDLAAYADRTVPIDVVIGERTPFGCYWLDGEIVQNSGPPTEPFDPGVS